jgi:hypothetical protein
MARLLLVRVVGGIGLVSLALFFVGLIPFLSAEPTAGAGLPGRAPGFTVNHEFKGDRLPLNPVASRDADGKDRPRGIPIGCDAAFSPISAPDLAHIFGRCVS